MVICGAWVAAVHWPVLSAQAISFDDGYYLGSGSPISNPGWVSIERLFRETFKPTVIPGYTHPAAMLSLMLDYALGGRLDNLFAFHCTNLILHVMNTLLVIVLMNRLFGSPAAAAAAGLLFGLHPLTVEPVAWIAQRKAILAGAFASWCLLFYAWHVHRRRWWLYAASLVAYGLAVMSKPTALPIPALLLVLDFWPLRRLSLRSLWEKTPFFVLGAGGAVVATVSHARTLGVSLLPDSGGPALPLVMCDKLALAFRSIIWPSRLSCYYPASSTLPLSEPAVIASVVGTCIVVALVIVSARRTRAILAGTGFFMLALSPMLGAVGYSWIYFQDCYLYLPLLGLVLLLAWLGSRAFRPAGGSGRRRWARCGFAIAVLAAGAGESWETRGRLRNWQGRTAQYEHMLALYPNAWVLHNNLGTILSDQGDLDGALGHQRRALDLKPTGDDAVRTHRGLGTTLARLGKLVEAKEEFATALLAAPQEIGERHDYAARLAQEGHLVEARAQLSAIVEVRPDWAEARNNLGNVLHELGEADQAVAQYAEAVRLRPGYVEAHANMGAVLSDLGRGDEAVEQFETALRLDAANAKSHYRLGDIYLGQGRFEEAVRHYEEALRVKPNDWMTQLNLGVGLAELGRFVEAAEAHRKAAELNPRCAECWLRLGQDLEMQGQTEAAKTAYRRAWEIDPQRVRAETQPTAAGAKAGQ